MVSDPNSGCSTRRHALPFFVVDLDDLVQQLGTPRRLDAMRALVGGVNATELRAAKVTEPVFAAIVAGLSDPNAQTRW
jgi:hypothetical protein